MITFPPCPTIGINPENLSEHAAKDGGNFCLHQIESTKNIPGIHGQQPLRLGKVRELWRLSKGRGAHKRKPCERLTSRQVLQDTLQPCLAVLLLQLLVQLCHAVAHGPLPHHPQHPDVT